jgi:hypothetical protein
MLWLGYAMRNGSLTHAFKSAEKVGASPVQVIGLTHRVRWHL